MTVDDTSQKVSLTTELSDELEGKTDSDMVEVVLELRRHDKPVKASEASSRRERIEALKESFDRDVGTLEEAIRQVGGEITGRAWINQTVRARVPAPKVKELAAHEKIQTVDLPHQITSELS